MIQRTWWPRLNPNAQLAKGLVFAGLGGGASTLQYADASSYGNHGTLTNMDPATDWVFDPTLGRFALTGFSATEYVALPAGLTNLPASGDFAVSFFAKKSVTALNTAAIAWNGTDRLVIYPHDSYAGDGIRVFWRDVTSSGLNENGVTRTTGWNHYLFQSEGATLHRVYSDGVMVDSDGANRSGAGPFSGVRIGNFADDTAQNYAGGYLSDVMFFSRYLSPAERQQLADPSNVMLSGLILPPRRMVWPVAVAGTRYGWNTIYTSRGRLIKAS